MSAIANVGTGREVDVLILGAGASGLMCALHAARRGRRTVILDHGKGPGRKILIAGGGRCNFTNLDVTPGHYVSSNPHFCKSALARFTQWDFLAMVESHGIPWEERSHGQLFCKRTAKDILEMLLAEVEKAGAEIHLPLEIEGIAKVHEGFEVKTSRGLWKAQSLVVATGGLSIPPAGASPLGYRIAEQFGIQVVPPVAGLVPFTLHPPDKERFAPLSGIALPATLETGGFRYTENLLFTHRGLSGPVVLQVSNHWNPGQEVLIDLLPGTDLGEVLDRTARRHPDLLVRTLVGENLPKRLVEAVLPAELGGMRISRLTPKARAEVIASVQALRVVPAGTEGYRTAEVTRGGVDCDALSSKTMEAKAVPGLFFVGEVVDVTGWLGGYNLQWAWASGWSAGQAV